MAKDPILDLSTLIENRPPIRIDGQTYHLKSPEELSLFESQQFTSWGKELETLGADPARRLDMEKLLTEVALAALADVPAPVFEKLSGSQHMAIVEVFTGLQLERRLRLAGALVAQVPTNQQTGGSSSHASSSPSAVSPAGGSTAPQQPS